MAIRVFFFLRQLQASVRAEALALHGAPLRAHATLALLHVHPQIGLLGYSSYTFLADPRPTAAAPPHRSRSLALLLVVYARVHNSARWAKKVGPHSQRRQRHSITAHTLRDAASPASPLAQPSHQVVFLCLFARATSKSAYAHFLKLHALTSASAQRAAVRSGRCILHLPSNNSSI